MPQVDDDNVLPENDNIKVITCHYDCSSQDVHICKKCKNPFCIIHANRFSPNFCKECFRNLSLVETKFERKLEDFDIKKNELKITKQSCTQYNMDGLDWPFFHPWIQDLSDEELRTMINFHYFIMKTIETENDTRIIRSNQRVRTMPQAQRIVTQKTVTKVAKAVDTKEDMIKKLQKQGLPQNIIDMMVSAMSKT